MRILLLILIMSITITEIAAADDNVNLYLKKKITTDDKGTTTHEDVCFECKEMPKTPYTSPWDRGGTIEVRCILKMPLSEKLSEIEKRLDSSENSLKALINKKMKNVQTNILSEKEKIEIEKQFYKKIEEASRKIKDDLKKELLIAIREEFQKINIKKSE